MTEAEYESIRAQLDEVERLAEHLTPAEKLQLAEALGSYPKRYFSGMAGWGLFLRREQLKSKLAGCPLHVLAFLPSLEAIIAAEEMLRGER